MKNKKPQPSSLRKWLDNFGFPASTAGWCNTAAFFAIGFYLGSCKDGNILFRGDDHKGKRPAKNEQGPITPAQEPLRSRSQQLADMRLVDVTVPLLVLPTPSAGRGVFFAGAYPLPAGTTVSLYRCLLVRGDVLKQWRDDGTMSAAAWSFWRAYSVEVSSSSGGQLWRDTWQALPIGEMGGLDSVTWWKHGQLGDAAVGQALLAINARRLVDYRRPAHSPTLGTLLVHEMLYTGGQPRFSISMRSYAERPSPWLLPADTAGAPFLIGHTCPCFLLPCASSSYASIPCARYLCLTRACPARYLCLTRACRARYLCLTRACRASSMRTLSTSRAAMQLKTSAGCTEHSARRTRRRGRRQSIAAACCRP